VVGGHLKEGCIIRTNCELVIGILENIQFSRKADFDTGFYELVVDQTQAHPQQA
jgi:predicted DNA-binding protein with PD1-like motif